MEFFIEHIWYIGATFASGIVFGWATSNSFVARRIRRLGKTANLQEKRED